MLMDGHFLLKCGVDSLMWIYFSQGDGLYLLSSSSLCSACGKKSPLYFLVDRGDLVHLMIAENHRPKDLRLIVH